MFPRLVYESFRRQTRRKLLAGVAITLGVAVATAMIAVATDIGDKISRELRTYGANLVVTPQEDTLDVEIGGVNLKPPSDGAFLSEDDLPKIRGTFWHHNIVGFSPMLPVTASLADHGSVPVVGTYFSKPVQFGKDDFATGVRITHPWWKVEGAWPDDSSQDLLVGAHLAARLSVRAGDTISLAGKAHRVAGILSTGAAEDDQVRRNAVGGGNAPHEGDERRRGHAGIAAKLVHLVAGRLDQDRAAQVARQQQRCRQHVGMGRTDRGYGNGLARAISLVDVGQDHGASHLISWRARMAAPLAPLLSPKVGV